MECANNGGNNTCNKEKGSLKQEKIELDKIILNWDKSIPGDHENAGCIKMPIADVWNSLFEYCMF